MNAPQPLPRIPHAAADPRRSHNSSAEHLIPPPWRHHHFTALRAVHPRTGGRIRSWRAMAVPERNHSLVAAGRLDCARPLVDFDWKLKHAVASSSIASVDKPLLRLEFYISKASSKVEEAGLARVLPENQMQTSIAEFTRAQLQTLISAMDAIEHALEGAEVVAYS